MKKVVLVVFLLLNLFISEAFAAEIDPMANKRFLSYENLIKENQDKSLVRKLIAVNRFFNRLKYVEDKKTWGKNDYWAKPKEFLYKGKGDCEDYALAKLYALMQLGIPKNKFKLIYSKVKATKKSHLVLAYYHNDKKEPLILDNFNKKIISKTKRKDLVYIYAFNTIMLDK